MPIASITLECGMPLLVETMSGVRSAGLSWLLPGGVARDPVDKVGLSAVLAEMVLRGAGGKSSREHADAFDKLGVSRSVSAESQFISLGATMLGSRLLDALPLIVEIVRSPNLDAADFEPSRDLCLQAIESLKDDPQERVMHALRKRHNPEPIGRSSLGEPEGLARLTHADLAPAWSRTAVPGGAILAVAGGVEPEPVARRLNELLKGWGGAAAAVTWSGQGLRGVVHEQDETNQVHIAVCYDGPAETDHNCWLERVATAVLSGGMSGRLFSEVREKRALCYSVYASYSADKTHGRTVAYSGTTPERAQETLTVLMGELRRILTPQGRVTEDELRRAVVGLKSKLVMSGESSNARAAALARDQHRLGRPRSLDELAAQYDRVTLEGLNSYLAGRELGALTYATIGPSELAIP